MKEKSRLKRLVSMLIIIITVFILNISLYAEEKKFC